MPDESPGTEVEGELALYDRDNLTIHQRMIGILGELPPIGKNQRNTQQNFMFRGIDDVLNALNPLLAKWGVFYVPNVMERIESVRKTKSDSSLYVVNLRIEYTFFGVNGDSVYATVWGEGTDSGDKATNKAMTGAMKYALFQVFAISTQEAQDADRSSLEESNREPTAAEALAQRRAEWGDRALPEGWDTYDEMDAAHQAFTAGMGTLTPDVAATVKTWRKQRGMGWPMAREAYDRSLAAVEAFKHGEEPVEDDFGAIEEPVSQ
jgi:hypothetical protein